MKDSVHPGGGFLTPEEESGFLADQDRRRRRMGWILGAVVVGLMIFAYFYVRHVGLIDFDYTVIQGH